MLHGFFFNHGLFYTFMGPCVVCGYYILSILFAFVCLCHPLLFNFFLILFKTSLILFLYKDMLSEFFRPISPAKITMCACVEGKRMQMSWRDSKNKIDYGVYLMRYMEMYVGQGGV